MKIVLSGGGTLGSVSPTIAVWQALKEKETNLEALFIGTAKGPEKSFLRQYPEIEFRSIPSGKLRRYFSLQNFLDFFLILAGLFKSLVILSKFRPKVILAAGGFVSVPVILAAKIFGIKVAIHQLDIKPTLSNKLVQGLADIITVTFEKSLNDFPRKKTVLVGSVLRQEIQKVENSPLGNNLLILGGGTGASSLNKLIIKTLPFLPAAVKVMQITGKNKKTGFQAENYRQSELLTDDYYQEMAQADLVITRAGLSSLMELSYLAKPSIIIPLPKSHQEKNAKFFAHKRSAICLDQKELTPKMLADKIKTLLADPAKLKQLGQNINSLLVHNGRSKIAEIILNL